MLIGYARVSTGKQETSLKDQSEKIRAYCALHDLELMDVLEDEDSGSHVNRKGLKRALGLIKSKQCSGVVVYSLDRLTRSVRDLNGLLEQVGTLHSVSERLDSSTPSGRLAINILGTVSQSRSLGSSFISEPSHLYP